MTGTYLECDYCKKHIDLEAGKCGNYNQKAMDAGWVEDERAHGWGGLHFCCQEHSRAYHEFKDKQP